MCTETLPPPTTISLIDAEHDDLRPVSEIVKERLGRRLSPCTRWRWIRKGVKGVRLEVVYFAGTWCTTEKAFAEFLRAQTRAALGADAPATIQPRSAEKIAKLKAAGLLPR